MATIELKKSVKGKKTITYERKKSLRAYVCDSCGKVYKMKPYCNDDNLGIIRGTFDNCAIGFDGKGLGNMFSANVCSFKCADDIMKGGWKKIKEYKPYIKSKANLVRCELKVTSYVIKEDELIKEWEKRPFNTHNMTYGLCNM